MELYELYELAISVMLKEKLKEDLKAAMKAGDAVKRSTISLMLSVIKNRELDKRGRLAKSGTELSAVEAASELTDEEVVEAISSEIKKRKESITTYEQASRPELAEKERAELSILMTYMPVQMSEDEIRIAVKQAISQVHPAGIKDMGKVLSHLMPQVKGKADGQTVSAIVKEELSSIG